MQHLPLLEVRESEDSVHGLKLALPSDTVPGLLRTAEEDALDKRPGESPPHGSQEIRVPDRALRRCTRVTELYTSSRRVRHTLSPPAAPDQASATARLSTRKPAAYVALTLRPHVRVGRIQLPLRYSSCGSCSR